MIDEINKKLKKLEDDEKHIDETKNKLKEQLNKELLKTIISGKILNKVKWEFDSENSSGSFSFKSVPSLNKNDKITEMFGLYPHNSFNINKDIYLHGYDGEIFLIAYNMKGIKYLQKLGVPITKKVFVNRMKEIKENIKHDNKELQKMQITSKKLSIVKKK